MNDMTQMLHTMENTLRLQNRARAERRTQKAEEEKREFQEKLMRAAASKMELDGLGGRGTARPAHRHDGDRFHVLKAESLFVPVRALQGLSTLRGHCLTESINPVRTASLSPAASGGRRTV